ncbi:endo-1,4-beta-glucanase [Aspergillus melleus]|uniref:Endo-1,4-beta-glucanase n=1 Tax=Aspergillus melleus TaxID=138277 RepID=A0ACC3BAY2_9EURO|nr:endo-1,4-beta-glucanase [Aspergillus melleus]
MNQYRLRVEGQSFRDPENREVTLRGINVAGDAKYPKVPDLRSHDPARFFDADNVSFVGRPFLLEHADAHFNRLRTWGYNTIRYIFTWEAIEHAGPGLYDEEWLDFTVNVLRIAKKYEFYIFMDPHQDVWSRLSGGSGAPAWTLYAAGLNPKAFKSTQAALSHNVWDSPADFPKMLWCTNYTRLACQTMFTLFWAGRDFAPKALIDGMNIQDYLQGHFIAACRYLAQKIHEAGDLEHDVVIGWESLNEPHRGLVGVQDISVVPPEQHLQLGTSPSPFQGMMLGSGQPCEVATWDFRRFGPRRTGAQLIDPRGESAWLPAGYDDSRYGWRRDPGWKLGECLWAQHGVWDPSRKVLLRKDYFSRKPGATDEKLDYAGFTNYYFLNHYRAYKNAIRSVCGSTIMFCQPPVMELPPSIKGTGDDDPNMVHAVHFYDGLTLLTKHWNRLYNVDVVGILRGKHLTPAFGLKIGERSIRKSLRDQLRFLRQESIRHMGNRPLVFTEIGIPYDLDGKRAYKTGDYKCQIQAMDANHFALEGSTANGFTWWAYMVENDHTWGDQWNGEDLSIFSQDDQEVPRCIKTVSSNTISDESESHSDTRSLVGPCELQQTLEPRGYRAAEAYLRPSPTRVKGRVESHKFDLKKCTFKMTLSSEEATAPHAPSEIFLPGFHFPTNGTHVTVSGGTWEISEQVLDNVKFQQLRWWHTEGRVNIKVKGAANCKRGRFSMAALKISSGARGELE